MDDERPTASATPRRNFLRALALAPALAAGCAATRTAAPAHPAGPSGHSGNPHAGNPAAPAAGEGEGDPLDPLRAFPLAPDAEPAFVFRAAPARPGA
jgi:hypothetical protein